jgi:hypothetical protein
LFFSPDQQYILVVVGFPFSIRLGQLVIWQNKGLSGTINFTCSMPQKEEEEGGEDETH